MTETPNKPKRAWKVTKRSLLDRIAELESALRKERSLTPWQRFKRWAKA